jgi:hypothetical protein
MVGRFCFTAAGSWRAPSMNAGLVDRYRLLIFPVVVEGRFGACRDPETLWACRNQFLLPIALYTIPRTMCSRRLRRLVLILYLIFQRQLQGSVSAGTHK